MAHLSEHPAVHSPHPLSTVYEVGAGFVLVEQPLSMNSAAAYRCDRQGRKLGGQVAASLSPEGALLGAAVRLAL